MYMLYEVSILAIKLTSAGAAKAGAEAGQETGRRNERRRRADGFPLTVSPLCHSRAPKGGQRAQ
jgi:hypothetical protein